MIRFFIFILVVVASNQAVSQNAISTCFNSTYSGRSAAMIYTRKISKKNEIGGGFRYNINSFAHTDDQMNVFLKRLYATEPLHRLGLVAFYNRYIFDEWENIRPFLFYDFQTTYSTTFNRMFLPFSYDENNDVLYKMHLENFGPFIWIEQCFGAGFNVDIVKNWFFTQKVGFGVGLVLGREVKLLSTGNGWECEFGFIYVVGFGYRF